ncbi:hypothetical protein B7C42_07895 [Nocardia cerradoensis]|uniref:Uncharacterized protein n=1 Tax=Nocardia cerradoensis TaxID=85688 RepID=A0A231GTV6_9NOCA|nr:hypothetical protein B7C42_07895 [Nocardia cerradoensis]
MSVGSALGAVTTAGWRPSGSRSFQSPACQMTVAVLQVSDVSGCWV